MELDIGAEAAEGLLQRGFLHVRRVGEDEADLRRFITGVGSPRGGEFWGEIQVVRYSPRDVTSGKSIANSASELLAHTDGSFEPAPPDFLFLQCVRSDLPGYGDSYVIDSHAVLAALPSEFVDALQKPEFTFSRESETKSVSYTVPVVAMRRGRQSIRYRRDAVYDIRTETSIGAAALLALTDLLCGDQFKQQVHLEAGDVLWLDNSRTLHGRNHLSGKAERILNTGWADRGAVFDALLQP